MEGFQLDLGLHLDLSNRLVDRYVANANRQTEKAIRDIYQKAIPSSETEVYTLYKKLGGYVYTDLKTLGGNFEFKDASSETRAREGLVQATTHAREDPEKIAGLVLTNYGGTNKKRKTNDLGVATKSVIAEINYLHSQQIYPNLILLIERAEFALEDRGRNIEYIRQIDKEWMTKKNWPNNYNFYERRIKECDLNKLLAS